jgi:hypothetical protein
MMGVFTSGAAGSCHNVKRLDHDLFDRVRCSIRMALERREPDTAVILPGEQTA